MKYKTLNQTELNNSTNKVIDFVNIDVIRLWFLKFLRFVTFLAGRSRSDHPLMLIDCIGLAVFEMKSNEQD